MKKTAEKKKDSNHAVRKKLIIAIGAACVLSAAIAFAFLSAGPVANYGDTVSIYYTGTFDNGTEFGAKTNGTPLQITLGSTKVIPGLEQALMGVSAGQEKTVNIPVLMAYGPYNPALVMTINRTGVFANTSFEVGGYYAFRRPNDTEDQIMKIINVTPETVTWDENNPLAGENLTFSIKVVGVTKGVITPGPSAVTPDFSET